MRKNIFVACIVVLLCLIVPTFSFAGLIYQNFEPNNGTPPPPGNLAGNPEYCFGINGAQADKSIERAHAGTQSCKIVSGGNFGGASFPSQVQTYNMNFEWSRHDRLTFWIWADPTVQGDNEVRVRVFDHGPKYKDNGNPFDGFEVSSAKRALYHEWTQIAILFTQLPSDFDFAHVDKFNIVNEHPGNYFIDDVQVVTEERVYQTFEPGRCPPESDCGWTFPGTMLRVSTPGEPVHEGKQSWKMDTTVTFGGTGIQSQEKGSDALFPFEAFFHVDLNPQHLIPATFNRLTFWVHSPDMPGNQMDNNVGVEFFDHGTYHVNPAEVFTKKAGQLGAWTKLTVYYHDLLAQHPGFNLNDIDKIQFKFFWPGQYFLDDIRSTRFLSVPAVVKNPVTNQQEITWQTITSPPPHELQESVTGPEGPWQTVFEGNNNTYYLPTRLSSTWYRLRSKEEKIVTPAENPVNPIAYVSDWSEALNYQPTVVISSSALKQGNVAFNALNQANAYIVESAPAKKGPFNQIYQGPYTTLTGQAQQGKWYRVKALIKDQNGTVLDQTQWSPAISFQPQGGYVKAVGTELREMNGQGDAITLKGVNLGNFLLMETEFNGIDCGFVPDLNNPGKTIFKCDSDDFHIRENFQNHFGAGLAKALLQGYANAYIQEIDFDLLMQMGVNVVRLPIYFQALVNDEDQGHFTNYTYIDRVVQWCADRGMYVLLDLHGAPGGQNAEAHSGQKGQNHLFDNNAQGQIYRDQTQQIWESLATHYKDNPTVVGYDLLNEPFGAGAYPFADANGLWTLYNRLYQAIRAIDPQHLIVMESIPSELDWNTLPPPANYNWQNVQYEFHYYGFRFDAAGNIIGTLSFPEHQQYLIDGNDPNCATDPNKFCGKVQFSKQQNYNVPVLIGEFNGFSEKDIWDLHLNTYKNKNWSWMMWSYKVNPSPAIGKDWGLYVHSSYDEPLPNTLNDDWGTLARKFGKYGTSGYHTANTALINILKQFLPAPSAPIDMNWIDLVGMNFSQPILQLQKTAANGWGNGGAASDISFDGDGGVEFKAGETNTSRMCGLSAKNIDANYTTIDYAIYLYSGGTFYVFEKGVNRGSLGTYQTVDRFSIERVGSTVVYKKNGSIFYTSTVPSAGTLLADCAFFSSGATISDGKMIGLTVGAPGMVKNLTASSVDQGIDLKWDVPANNGAPITGYEIQYGTVASGGFGNILNDDVVAGATVSGLTPGVAYQFRVLAKNALGSGLVSNVVLITPETSYDIPWVDQLGVSVNGATVTKTAATGWGNAGAASLITFDKNAGMEFTVNETNTVRICGLSSKNQDANYTTIDYAIYPYSNGTLYVYEKGVSKGSFGTYQTGDKLRVERSGNTIFYKRNNTLLYTSTVPSSGVLVPDCAFYTSGAKITDGKIKGLIVGPPGAITNLTASVNGSDVNLMCDAPANNGSPITGYQIQYGTVASGGFASVLNDDASPGATLSGLTPEVRYQIHVVAINALGAGPASNVVTLTFKPVVWTDLVGVSVTGTTLTKTAALGWGNGGAASTESFSGNGLLEFTATQTNKARMCGLSSSNLDAQYTSIEYAVYLFNNGKIYVYEKGVNRGTFGNYATGDKFRVERTGNTIVYKKNGTVFYTSAVTTVAALKADSAFYENGSSVMDARFILP